MELLPSRTVKPGAASTRRRAQLTVLCAAILIGAPGCVTTEAFFHAEHAEADDICQVVAIWNPQVVFTPDPVHGGTPIPGIAGRAYLFGAQVDAPRTGSGGMVVDLYVDKDGPKGKTPIPLEEWRIDKDTLKKLRSRDAVGWGYSLFLPWATYNPDLQSVQLRLRYDKGKGFPLYAEPTSVTLNHDLVQTSNNSVQQLPAESTPAATGPQPGLQPTAFRPGKK